jgi:hypothetical protein
MKIIFGILASNNDNLLKESWVKSIKNFKNTDNKNLIDFFFLYSENTINELTNQDIQNRTDQHGNRLFYDYYSETKDETDTSSFVTRSISILKHLDQSQDGLPTYFIRTDITTLFDFNKMTTWLEDKPTELFFGGSIVNSIQPNNFFLSGTNLILSKDISKFLIQNQDIITQELADKSDDLAISNAIIKNVNVNLCSVKRIDFLCNETSKFINYHKCVPYDKNIFCFRFKTLDKPFDISLMDKLTFLISTSHFDLNDFIKNTNLKITSQHPEYDMLSDNIFKLT